MQKLQLQHNLLLVEADLVLRKLGLGGGGVGVFGLEFLVQRVLLQLLDFRGESGVVLVLGRGGGLLGLVLV